MQKYDFKFKYVPGKQLTNADTLSHAHLPKTNHQKEQNCEEIEPYVNLVFILTRNSYDILQESDIKRETAKHNSQ